MKWPLQTKSGRIKFLVLAALLAASLLVWLSRAWAQGQPTVSLSSSTYTVGENDANVTITVQLSAASQSMITVSYATANGSATSAMDYSWTSGQLTFMPNETSKTVNVGILQDTSNEGSETFTFSLNPPAMGATIGSPSSATITILDDDGTQPSVAFSSSSYSVNENGSSATITVNLSAAFGRTVSVNYATSNGSATAGQDYTSTSGTLNFTSGQTSGTFAVPILNDSTYEGNETVNLALSSPSYCSLGSPSSATLTILEDDPVPPTVQFSQANYNVDENAGQATITVLLSFSSSQVVSVDYVIANGTAVSPDDYSGANGTLTFPIGTVSQSFSINLATDDLFEPDETVLLSLSNPINATFGTQSTSLVYILDNDFDCDSP